MIRSPNRRHALTLMGGTAAAALTGMPAMAQTEDWAALGADVKAEFKWAYGYTALADITTRPMTQGDNCPGYWWSEQMKYYFLMFAEPKRVDLSKLVLSTEANVLRGFRP